MTLGERLRQLRQAKGLSQEEVAQALFLTRQSVSKWENDQTEPGVEHLKALSKFYAVTVDELIGSVPEKSESLPQALLEGALALGLVLAALGLFWLEDGWLCALAFPVMLAALRWRSRGLWLAILILEGIGAFFISLQAIWAVWFQGPGGSLPQLLMLAGTVTELVLFFQPTMKWYFCKG